MAGIHQPAAAKPIPVLPTVGQRQPASAVEHSSCVAVQQVLLATDTASAARTAQGQLAADTAQDQVVVQAPVAETAVFRMR